MPAIRAGDLNSRVTIQAPSGSPADDGQPSGEYEDFLTGVPAQIRGVGGGEFIRGVQVQAGITNLITIRFRDDVTPNMRVIYGERTLNIQAAIDPEGRRRELQLHCKELA